MYLWFHSNNHSPLVEPYMPYIDLRVLLYIYFSLCLVKALCDLVIKSKDD